MKLNLDQLENRLQNFIENSLAFSRRSPSLAQKLVAAMQGSLVAGTNGSLLAPSNYVLRLNPQTLAQWQANPEMIDRLAEVLDQTGREAGVRFMSPINIRLAADYSLPPDEVQVMASAARSSGTTAAMPALPVREDAELQDAYPPGAFLVVNGIETFPLRQAVINIGRRLDNHIIISDPRVSRSHAQLRAIRGRYVLFDLNSSGGTFVNSIRVTQQTLKPGDVISLAGVSLIYGEETPPRDSDTSVFRPGHSE